MWLLNAKTYELEVFEGDNIPSYAILSHRWDADEPTFKDVTKKRYHDKRGFRKVEASCREALAQNLSYVWADTCCIDKRSSAELSEAVNSMYEWYSRSTVCFAYLSDIPPKREGQEPTTDGKRSKLGMTFSVWFTRGWTLQELLAPRNVRFYDCEWNYIGSKADHAAQIRFRTNIPGEALRSFQPGDWSILERMSWANGRETTRVEDRAYSLLGIFEINMPLLYGERNRAFKRLQESIAATSADLSLFGWIGLPHEDNQLLARSPESFDNGISLQWYGTPDKSPLQPVHINQTGYTRFKSFTGRYVLTKEGIEGFLPLHHHVFNVYSLGIGHFKLDRDMYVTNTTEKPLPLYYRICIFFEYDGHFNIYRRVRFDGMDCVVFGYDKSESSFSSDMFHLTQIPSKDVKIVNQQVADVSATHFASQQWSRFLGMNPDTASFGMHFVSAGTKWNPLAVGDDSVVSSLSGKPVTTQPQSRLGESACIVLSIWVRDFQRELRKCFIVISFELDIFSTSLNVLFFFCISNDLQKRLMNIGSNPKRNWDLECSSGYVTLSSTGILTDILTRNLPNTLNNKNMQSRAIDGNILPLEPKITMSSIELGPSRRTIEPEPLRLTISELATPSTPAETLTVHLHLDFNCYIPGIERFPHMWASFPGLKSMPHISIWGRHIYDKSSGWPGQSAFESYVQAPDYVRSYPFEPDTLFRRAKTDT